MTQDILATGAAWLQTQRRAHLAGTVTYDDRTNPPAAGIVATRGESERDTTDEDGAAAVYLARDYLIDAADLAAALPGFEAPEEGHRITDAGHVYIVANPTGDPWDWHDRARTVYRIHTNHFGPAA